jgi:hypothetical protein
VEHFKREVNLNLSDNLDDIIRVRRFAFGVDEEVNFCCSTTRGEMLVCVNDNGDEHLELIGVVKQLLTTEFSLTGLTE